MAGSETIYRSPSVQPDASHAGAIRHSNAVGEQNDFVTYAFNVSSGCGGVHSVALWYASANEHRPIHMSLNGVESSGVLDVPTPIAPGYARVQAGQVSMQDGQNELKIWSDYPKIIPDISQVQLTRVGTGGAPGGQRPPSRKTVISVVLNPQDATLDGVQKSARFVATVAGTADRSVKWSIQPQVGELKPDGQNAAEYIAPGTVAESETITFTAASNADPTKTASAKITLKANVPPSPRTIILWTALGIAAILTFLVTLIQIGEVTSRFFVYLALLEILNLATTCFCVYTMGDKVSELLKLHASSELPALLWALFFAVVGVIGSQFLLSRMTIALFGKGLKLDEWTSDARGQAILAAGRKKSDRLEDEQQQLVDSLKQLVQSELDTYVLDVCGKATLDGANQAPDPQLAKVLALIAKNRNQAKAIRKRMLRKMS